eukprot:GHVT01044565.1.p2 GENE.GHVT01044565.1~~GHVT01044565.1.p2  ORF type:complete len:114 (-),score=20.76 GHVT01044565.1:117-458(-)
MVCRTLAKSIHRQDVGVVFLLADGEVAAVGREGQAPHGTGRHVHATALLTICADLGEHCRGAPARTPRQQTGRRNGTGDAKGSKRAIAHQSTKGEEWEGGGKKKLDSSSFHEQ